MLSKVMCLLYCCLEIQSLIVLLLVLSHSWRCIGNGCLNYIQFYCVAGFLFLFSMVIHYGLVGSFGVEYVVEVLRSLALVGYVSSYLCLIWTSSLTGLLFKVYAFPVSYGVLNINESVPLGVLFLLLVMVQFFVFMVVVGVCNMLTLAYFVLLGICSLVIGFVGGVVESGIARCLGYSSIGNSGFVLLGLGCGYEVFNSYVIM